MSGVPIGAADPHNFGQSVSKTTESGLHFFEKPRPVFWEWLFFGSNSPLRAALSDKSLPEAVFGLDVVFDTLTGKGKSREVRRTDGHFSSTAPQTYSRYGQLIAYCYAFGILDLHDGNLIPIDGRTQVVDTEIVLARLHLPDETLLLPFKDVPFEDSGLKLLIKTPAELTAENAEILIAGFVDGLIQLESRGPVLVEVLDREISARPPYPIRVILRNTRRYYEYRSTIFDIPLMPEELVQLARGDIPYFFKFLGDSNLYHYVSPDGDYERVNIPDAYREAVDRVGKLPAELLSSKRFRQDLFPLGVLLLARKLVPGSYSGEMKIEHSELTLSDVEMRLSGLWGSFKTNRVRVFGTD